VIRKRLVYGPTHARLEAAFAIGGEASTKSSRMFAYGRGAVTHASGRPWTSSVSTKPRLLEMLEDAEADGVAELLARAAGGGVSMKTRSYGS